MVPIKMKRSFLLTILYFCSLISVNAQSPDSIQDSLVEEKLINHSLKIFLDPMARTISVEDIISIPEQLHGNSLTFELNSNLTITESTGDLEQLLNIASEPSNGLNGGSVSALEVNEYSIPLSSTNNESCIHKFKSSISLSFPPIQRRSQYTYILFADIL